MSVQIAFMYGIHPHEKSAVEVGKAIAKDRYFKTIPAVMNPTTRLQNYQNAFNNGMDILIDLHGGGYMAQDRNHIRGGKDFFITPVIPIKNGRKVRDVLSENYMSELGNKYRYFFVSRLSESSEIEFEFPIIWSDGEALVQRNVKKYTSERNSMEHLFYLRKNGLYSRLITIEYWKHFLKEISESDTDIIGQFKADTYWFAEWVQKNAQELFL